MIIPSRLWPRWLVSAPLILPGVLRRHEAVTSVTSTYVGYWSTEEAHGEDWKLHPGARRFEVGGRQTAAVAAQAAALNWLEGTVGHPWLFERIAELNRYAFHALQTVPNLQLLTPNPGTSGLLAFTLDGQGPDEIMAYLREQHHIYTCTIPEMNSVRISTSFYNTEEEIDTLVKALANYQQNQWQTASSGSPFIIVRSQFKRGTDLYPFL